jgi:Protein of unknown function (DUF433)
VGRLALASGCPENPRVGGSIPPLATITNAARVDSCPNRLQIAGRCQPLRFGRPVIAGTGVATEVIADCYNAGESIQELARDYGRPAEEVEEAIRCELEAA